jgi:hypothetical protein
VGLSNPFYAEAKNTGPNVSLTVPKEKAVSFDTTLTFGGGGGIRTLETVSGLAVFKTTALNHYATPPARELYQIIINDYRLNYYHGLFFHQLHSKRQTNGLAWFLLQ